MSRTVKLTVSEKQMKELKEAAREKHVSVSDYIRGILFDGIETYDMEKFAKIALEHYEGKLFTVVDLCDKYGRVQKEYVPIISKTFFAYIKEHPELGIVKLDKRLNRRIAYTVTSK